MKKQMIVFLFALLLVISLSLFAYADEKNQSRNGNHDDLNETEYDEENETEDNEEDNETEHHFKNISKFFPWQQRNESECPEECECHGAVVSCEIENGKIITITAGNSGNVITIVINETEVDTEMELEQERDNETNKSKIRARLSNGKNAEIKIMPDVASERALERLRLKICNVTNNCTIILKEVENEGNNTHNGTAAYEMQVQRHVRILGLFKTRIQERAEVNAENGEVKEHGPWWVFLATKEQD
jgi:hypothetical protein